MALRIPMTGIPPDVRRAIRRRARIDRPPTFSELIGSDPGVAPVRTGQVYAGVTAGIQALAEVQRANMLLRAARGATGSPSTRTNELGLAVTPEALKVKQTLAHIKETGGGGVGGFLQNLLGEPGLYGAVTHLPGGLFTAGKDIGAVGLAAAGFRNDPEAVHRLSKDVLKPIAEGYKYSYGPLVHGDLGKFAEHFYKRPLGPVLDVAAVASGGLGVAGRVGARLAPEGRFASVISREGRGGVPRPPVQLRHGMSDRAVQQLGESVPAIPRMYSTQPLRHIAQLGMDRIVAGGLGARRVPGFGGTLQDFQQIRAINKWTDKTHAQQVMESQLRGRLAANSFVKSLNRLDPAEQTALHFALRGVNDRALLSVAQDYWRKSIEGTNPAGHNLSDFAGIPEEYVHHLANLPDNVVSLIEHPTQGMVDAANLWHVAVEQGRMELGIDPLIHAENTVATHRALSGKGGEKLTPEEVQQILDGDLSAFKPPPNAEGVPYPINPSYVPDMPASGMKFGQKRSGALSFLARRLGVSGKDYVLSPGERKIQITRTGPDTIIRPPFQPYLKDSDLSTFHAGAFRTDAKALVDHITRREEDLVHQVFNQKLVDRMALRDENGARTFKNQLEVDHATGGGYTFVPIDGSIRWFQAENNVLKEAVKRMEELEQHGQLGSPEMLGQLNRLLQTNAKDFVTRDLMAVRNPGIAVPTQFAKRMEAIFKSRDPFLGNFYQKMLNKWRTWTLAYMPRWWINTAVGTAVLNGIKGVWNPRDYIEAKRLMSSGKLPAGVHLGGFAEHEALEGQSGLLTARAPTRKLYQMVANLESFFRTASFVQSLKAEQKRAMRGIGDVLSGYKPIMRSEMKHSDFIDHLLENPTLVEHALDDVNRFAYNMTELGPIERRYVRSFIPFWGWYKFITKLVWRLPVEYPGRTLILEKLGDIGVNQENQLGPIPDWMRGSIFLNMDKKALAYLPTRGLNPFAQFANPFSPAGTIQGLLSWGQLAPPIQAAIAGAGVDTLTGGPSQISPQEGVGFDFWGNPIDVTNGKVLENVGQKAGFRRAVGTFLRSFPQFRIGEAWETGGNPVYPESIPFIAPRPKAVRPETRRPFSLPGLLGQYSGIYPRTTNLGLSQLLDLKRIQYGAQTQKRRLRQTQQRLNVP